MVENGLFGMQVQGRDGPLEFLSGKICSGSQPMDSAVQEVCSLRMVLSER